MKLGAKDGDTWRWESKSGTVEYKVEFGAKYLGGIPAVIIRKTQSKPLPMMQTFMYAEGIGEVERTSVLTLKEGAKQSFVIKLVPEISTPPAPGPTVITKATEVQNAFMKEVRDKLGDEKREAGQGFVIRNNLSDWKGIGYFIEVFPDCVVAYSGWRIGSDHLNAIEGNPVEEDRISGAVGSLVDTALREFLVVNSVANIKCITRTRADRMAGIVVGMKRFPYADNKAVPSLHGSLEAAVKAKAGIIQSK